MLIDLNRSPQPQERASLASLPTGKSGSAPSLPLQIRLLLILLQGSKQVCKRRWEIEVDDLMVRMALERHWAASDASDFEVEHEIYREERNN